MGRLSYVWCRRQFFRNLRDLFADPPRPPVQILHHGLGIALLLEYRPRHVPALLVVLILKVLLALHVLLRVSFLK